MAWLDRVGSISLSVLLAIAVAPACGDADGGSTTGAGTTGAGTMGAGTTGEGTTPAGTTGEGTMGDETGGQSGGSCEEQYTDLQCFGPPGQATEGTSSGGDGSSEGTGAGETTSGGAGSSDSSGTAGGGLCDEYIDNPPELFPGGPGGGEITGVNGPLEMDGLCCFEVTWSQWCPCDRGCG